MEHYENQSSSNLDLAQFDDAFETAEVEEREFEAVPDGKYQVNVDRVELTRENEVARYNVGTKATGALRRASMELTRALAEMRKP